MGSYRWPLHDFCNSPAVHSLAFPEGEHSTKFCRLLNMPWQRPLPLTFRAIPGGESKVEASPPFCSHHPAPKATRRGLFHGALRCLQNPALCSPYGNTTEFTMPFMCHSEGSPNLQRMHWADLRRRGWNSQDDFCNSGFNPLILDSAWLLYVFLKVSKNFPRIFKWLRFASSAWIPNNNLICFPAT